MGCAARRFAASEQTGKRAHHIPRSLSPDQSHSQCVIASILRIETSEDSGVPFEGFGELRGGGPWISRKLRRAPESSGELRRALE
eukprot:745756-Alexandrium_andersonii.AAC.1